ncbi:MAB_1171c family putative transporter [Streptomyces sp. NPDC014991]|uniref:MAB_1171c family putative transporter n=1 Tax=Streptomyces sp. NPDC014991 TaxID=3364935 RepID=UPI0036F7A323
MPETEERNSKVTSGPSTLVFYASGVILLLVCALKIPALIRRRHDPLLRAACLLLFAGGCIMLLAAPESIVKLDQLTGVANFAAPVVYATTVAYSAASLLLIINWRSAPPDRTKHASRLCITVYSLAILAIFVLFSAGNAPVQQLTLFDAYYANTPYIREMIVTYLVAHGIAAMTTSALCWRWSKQVNGSLRAGLRFLAPAYLLHVCYDVMRLIAVAARWTGHDLNFLVDKISPQLAAPSAVLGAIGFILPLVGPRIAATARIIGQLHRLTPLWQALRQVSTPGAIRTSLPWWRTPPAVLLTWRKTALYDALLALAPYYDHSVRETAHRAARRNGDEEPTATAIADAAMILAARERQATTSEQVHDAPDTSRWRPQDLVPLSLALTSPIVRNVLEHRVSLQEAARHE